MKKDFLGFTIIELLIVIAVMATLITMSVAVFVNLNHNQALERTTAQVVALMQATRSKAQTSKADAQYGVHLQTDRIIAFVGTTYETTAPDNIILSFDDVSLSATSSTVGGGQNIIFKKISGATDNPGTFNLTLSSLPTIVKMVKIEATGLISVQENVQ